ncbi:unnamed protein product, partial [Meganyctiphanes norvegica]
MSHVNENGITRDEGHYPEEIMRKSDFGIYEIKIKEENEEPIKSETADIELKEDLDINDGPIHFTEGSYIVKNESSLQGQLITNTRENTFQCSQSDEALSYNNLMNQMRTHCGEKLYQCKRCDKEFPNKSSIIKHQRTHTGEKPY